MKRLRRQKRIKRGGVSLPVLLAVCLLLLAAGCLVQHRMSAKRQGAELVSRLYEADREPMLKELAAAGLPRLYEERFGSRITEQGRNALSKVGTPYCLLFREFSAPVERTYAVSVRLEPDTAKEISSRSFHYSVDVDFYLEKGIEALAPVERLTFEGTIQLKKSGFLGWQLDGFTVG